MCAKTSFFSNFDRDAVSDVSYIHFWFKMKIMVVKDIEREDIEFITKVQLKNSWLIKYVLILCWILDIELPTHRQFGSFLARIYGNC